MSQPLAIVTGASSGIGASVARALAVRGWRTVLIARREAALRDLAAELSALAPSDYAVADLSNLDSIEPVLEAVMGRHGAPALLVNNAGFGLYKPFLDHSIAEHERLMNVLYFAPVRATRVVLPHMLARPAGDAALGGARGQVINVSSMSVKMGAWGHAGYGAAKSALRTLTQTLAAEHRGDGVRFSTVCPGIVDTAYFTKPDIAPLFSKMRGRAIGPDRVARAVVGLLRRPRLEVCVPWHYRALDLISAISPGLAHRMVAGQSRVRRGE